MEPGSVSRVPVKQLSNLVPKSERRLKRLEIRSEAQLLIANRDVSNQEPSFVFHSLATETSFAVFTASAP